MAEVAEEFAASLSDLTVNSKPHINMLTMLAEDNHEYAANITQTVLNHLQKVPPEIKLPVLYLIDSIVKNVGKSYIPLFTQAIVQHFSQTFEKVDEKTREQMFKLRQTWNDVFPAKIMYALDAKVQKIDPAWPCTAAPPSSVHLNPKFFKPDMIDSKSLTTTIKDPDSHRSRNRKNRSTSHIHSSSSRSKKSTNQVSSTSVDSAKTPSSSNESLREQVILQQKMLLELQQQKLKLELLQTQAQLEEQQKQLERQTLSHKTSSESSAKALKLQQMVNEEAVKYRLMNKNLKKHMQSRFSKLQEVHRATSEMKAQAQKGDISKGLPLVPEGLLKPAALLELDQEELHVKPAKPATSTKRLIPPSQVTVPVPKESKSKNVSFPAMDKHKIAAQADSTEDVAPPVRIAPVSSQLINAALSFGRNVRDPRIRQMSSRLESQLNSSAVPSIPTSTPLVTQPITPNTVPAAASFPTKKSETSHENKSHSKSRRDKKSNNSHQHREKSSRSSEEDNKFNKSPSRSSERSNRKGSGKKEKSPSKKGEEKSDKKSKVNTFLTRSKSPIHVRPESSSQSPLKSQSKRNQESLPSSTVELSPKMNFNDRVHRKEPSPKRAKLQDNWPSLLSEESTGEFEDKAIPLKQDPKLNVDVKVLQNIKQPDSTEDRLSLESLDDGVDMLDEDIEKIVKSAPKINKFVQKDMLHVDDIDKSPKSYNDSPHASFEDIVKHPSKQMKIHEINRYDDSIVKSPNSMPVEVSNLSNVRHNLETKTISKSVNVSETVRTGLKTSEIACKPVALDFQNSALQINAQTITKTLDYNQDQQSVQSKTVNAQQNPVITSTPSVTFPSKDPRLQCHIQENKLVDDKHARLSIQEESKDAVKEEVSFKVDDTKLFNFSEPGEVSSSINTFCDNRDMNDKFIEEKVVAKEMSEPAQNEYEPSSSKMSDNQISSFDAEKSTEFQNIIPPSPPPVAPDQQMECEPKEVSLFSSNYSEQLTLSPRNVTSPVRNVPALDAIHAIDESIAASTEFSSSQKTDKRAGSPVYQEKKARKGEKPSIMEQLIADAEKHDASPSPPPPPVISDKFKEIKQSSLSRLRRVGRLRDDLEEPESPECTDVDLRTLPPTLTKDSKNEVLGLADRGDVDLRNPPASPTKKRPSMEKPLDSPPAKKPKAEILALFGTTDFDHRQKLCPLLPSPPPPPIISSSPPPDSAGERLWARYKETKPDTYKAKYTPSRRDRAPSVDKFSSRNSESSNWVGRPRSYPKDIDMRNQLHEGTDGSYNQIVLQAFELHQRGDLKDNEYKRVLSDVCVMREKRQLEEAQRREEEVAAQAEHLQPISDDEISGGSLSGVEDAPSPTDSYTGEEDPEEFSLKKPHSEDSIKPSNEHEAKDIEGIEDEDIRRPPTNVDIRRGFPSRMEIDGQMPLVEENARKTRGESPYSRRSRDEEKDRLRSHREELRAQRREKRARRSEERRELQYRNSRYAEDNWSSQEKTEPPDETRMDVEPPRVPPIPHYREPLLPPRDFSIEQRDNPSVHSLGPWDMQRMVAPPPWLPGMAPPPLGPPGMGLRPILPERFMPPRWRQPVPGPMFEGEPPGSRFNRFGLPMGRFPLPLAPCEVPPSDPAVLKLIEEDPTKSICIDGVPRDIRFYGAKAVALMSWDDPREVSFQNGSRRIIVDDRDSLVVHLNGPPQEMIIDGKPHRVRFGAPTRELYIDNQWYEVFFGGPPATCDIGGKPHQVLLEGPPPNVRPGIQRKDLVVAKITLIIDAEYIFSIYLDAKPQKFEVDGVAYIIRFVEALQKTVINGVAFKSDFGGLPRPIILNGTKHFFRLTALPKGVTPGFLTIVNMEGGRLPSPPILPAPPQLPASLEKAVGFNTEPKIVDPFLQPPPIITAPPPLSPEVFKREVDTLPLLPTTLPLPIPPEVPLTISEPVPTLDMLTTLMPTPEPGRAVDYSYSVDNENSNHTTALTTTTDTSTTTTATSIGEINVTELLQKLMATGIVPKLDQPKDKDQDKPVTTDSGLIRPVDFRKPETLKIRQSALVSHLYSGIQCNSCGVRFPPEQTMKYSQHLDWHFRQNRRDKDSTRTAQTRRYYYDVNDWVQFEEIEDLEERAQPWFDMQEGAAAAGVTDETQPAELVSVRAADYPEDAACQICHDKFESFYNEEKEEWQLRNAVDTEGKLAHPLCIEDQRAAAEKPIVLDDIDITGDESKEEEDVKETKETEAEPPKVEEDDDIMEVTDIEFVKPVFPVEDLTVSDSESVADNEEKPELLENDLGKKTENEKLDLETVVRTDETQVEVEAKLDETKERVKDESMEEHSKEESDQIDVEMTKDENTQDDLILVDKEEDSIPSETEIMEVVRNIKKDPDALGGEYEETQDPNVKKEKGEIPLPSPVVDTTHATVTCLIDGNVEFDETPQQLAVGVPPKIKINITKPIVQSVPKEPKEVAIEIVDNDSSALAEKLALVTQPPPPGEEPLPLNVKEKLRGKQLQELPRVMKGKEMSGLCSIM